MEAPEPVTRTPAPAARALVDPVIVSIFEWVDAEAADRADEPLPLDD